MTYTFILFHLNLAYSSIAESARQDVIKRCYYPLLALARKTKIPIGIELTSWTLKQIQSLEPQFIVELRQLISEGQCELIGSGYTQTIGPLVPAEVNYWNQHLAFDDYQCILGVTPKLVLVNEMAYSTSLVELYRQAGYEGMIMDRDNVRLALGLESEGYESVPSHALGLNDSTIPVLWSDSLLFQKLQRYAHGDSRLTDYIDFFKKRALVAKRPLAIYCNDVEIFDYRPGRFREERPAHEEGEWNRLERLLMTLTVQEKVQWLSPSDALAESLQAVTHEVKTLTSIAQPIPVKKQAKYNISRWAITGRNDLWINTLCYRIANALHGSTDQVYWRRLLELWASDIRTHIEKKRWQQACVDLVALATELRVSFDYGTEKSLPVDSALEDLVLSPFEIIQDCETILLTVKTAHLEVIFNLRRGLAIHSLAFKTHDFTPIIGTIPHGYFDSIEYGADFYSSGVVLEYPAEHCRITDFERVTPSFRLIENNLEISVVISTDKGQIVKRYYISAEDQKVTSSIEFPNWQREHAIVRAGTMTFLPEAFLTPLYLKTHNGGVDMESFCVNTVCDPCRAASSLVSCSTGLGATQGEIIIGDQFRQVKLSWDPSQCAVFPMLSHQPFKTKPLTRLFFSLNELDETMHEGGVLPCFQLSIEAFKV